MKKHEMSKDVYKGLRDAQWKCRFKDPSKGVHRSELYE
jgi:hypothetical protein